MPQFDAAAKTYDTAFTFSHVGAAQRRAVWSYLDQTLGSELRILELNGGTGEDAVWLAGSKHEVVCTDVSPEMLKVAQRKAAEADFPIQFEALDLTNPTQFKPAHKFDAVFSNFAGLNCLDSDQLAAVFDTMNDWLTPGGEAILVFLGKYCIWEAKYFLLRGRPKSAGRRWTRDEVTANVDGQDVGVWYYTSQEIRRISAKHFETVQVKPIGLFVPPSYLNGFFQSRLNVLKKLEQMDNAFGSSPIFSNFSDHFLIHLRKK